MDEARQPSDARTYRWPLRFLQKHWNGEYSLARSYWLNTVLVSLFAPGLGLVLFPLLKDRPARFSSAAALLLTALGYAAWFWAVRGTWVSATRHKIAGGKWGTIAKGMIIFGFLGVAGRVGRDGGRLREHWATLLGKQAGPRYAVHVSRDGKSLKVTGGMNDGAAEALGRALALAPGVRTVSFNSGGGWIREGRLMATVISERHLATHVDGECSSACTLAFLAGKERTLGSRGRLGFHQVRSIGQTDLARVLDIEQTQEIFRGAGLPSDFIDKVMATPPDKIWYPTQAELLAANVITGRTEWDAARADVTAKLRPSLQTNLKTLRIPDEEFNALLDCEVSEYLKWLNTTDCPYLYDKQTKTLAKHLEEQTACLDKADSTTKLQEIDLACTKRRLSNDWSIYSDVFAKAFARRFDRQHVSSPTAQRVGACAAAQYVAQLSRAGCVPMNLEASTEEALFATDCIDKLKPKWDRQMPAVFRDCRAVAGRD
jgi:hypothetical protein